MLAIWFQPPENDLSTAEITSFSDFDLILIISIPIRIRTIAQHSYKSGTSFRSMNANIRVKKGDNIVNLEIVSDEADLIPLYHINWPKTITRIA